MRKWLLGGSAIALILCSFLFLLGMQEQSGIVCRCISEQKANKYREKYGQETQEMDFRLCFEGCELAFDRGSKTFFLPLELQDSMWESGKITATNQVEVFFLEDFRKEDKQKLLQSNRTIPFLALSGKQYSTYYLKLTGLPIMDLESSKLATEVGEPLFYMTLYQNEPEKEFVAESLATSTLRGNTSLTYEKKSLRLKLKKEKDGSFVSDKKNLLGIRKDDDWILNSLYADNSRIRDKLCMDLWQETGAHTNPYGQNFGMTGEYVELFINDGYAGLYLLSHPIDKKQLGMRSVSAQLETAEPVIERIYKKKYTADLKSTDFEGALPDENMPWYRGGYVLKGNTILQNEAEWEGLHELAKAYEGDDTIFSRNLPQLMDMDNLMQVWLFFQAIGGFDNENKNYYYVNRNKNGQSVGYFIPWDLNISFGCVYAENPYYCEETMDEVERAVAFQPAQRAYEENVAGAKELVRATWQSWREDEFAEDKVLARIEALQNELVLSGALSREMERWPDGNASEDISHLKDFAKRRLVWLDEYVK